MRCARGWYWRLGCVLLITVFMSGCPKKTPPPSETPPGGMGTGGLGQENLPSPSPGDHTRDLIEGRGESSPLQDVHFAYDSYDLDGSARDVLAANAEWLKENKRARTEIEGHCDERGTVEYNLALGAKRAKAVKDYLVTLGVASDRLTTISYGEELPLCRDASEQCYARNRRVHFVPPSE